MVDCVSAVWKIPGLVKFLLEMKLSESWHETVNFISVAELEMKMLVIQQNCVCDILSR